ncbi:MAG: hypothetical protein JNK05_40820 [Myxococcales bacterium]|nr:hypothetical protein [Myxococcales bacterium]
MRLDEGWIDACWARYEARISPYVTSDAIASLDRGDPVALWDALVGRGLLPFDWSDGSARRYATGGRRFTNTEVPSERTRVGEHHDIRSSSVPTQRTLARWLASDPARTLACESLALDAARAYSLATTGRACGASRVLWTCKRRSAPSYGARVNRLLELAGPLLGDPSQPVNADQAVIDAVRSERAASRRRALNAHIDDRIARSFPDAAMTYLLRAAVTWSVFCESIEPVVSSDGALQWTVDRSAFGLPPKSLSLTRAQLVEPLLCTIDLRAYWCELLEFNAEWVYVGLVA